MCCSGVAVCVAVLCVGLQMMRLLRSMRALLRSGSVLQRCCSVCCTVCVAALLQSVLLCVCCSGVAVCVAVLCIGLQMMRLLRVMRAPLRSGSVLQRCCGVCCSVCVAAVLQCVLQCCVLGCR